MMKTTFTTLSLLLLAFFGYAQNGPITFEPGEEGADWTWTVFENDTNPDLEIIPNPDPTGANTSATVAQFTALQSGAPFAGCESQQIVDLGAFEWDSTNRTVKIMVWKSVISDVGIKFDTDTGWSEGEEKVANTVVEEWEELTFDFSDAMNPPPSEGELSRIVVFPDFNLDGRTQDNVVYFDNIRFEEGGGGNPVDEPTAAAPDPEEEESDVLSLFSGVYTDVDVNTWRTPWSSGDLEDIEIEGNATKKYTNLDFVGVETTGDNLVDASDMEFFHVDVWTPNMETIRIKLVDFGADGEFQGGDDSEHELIFTDLPQGEWNSLKLPLEDFVDLENRENLAQYIFSGLPAGAGTLYIDNVYFSKTGGGGGPDEEVVGVDASADFLGFANVFETQANGGAFVFGSAWGVPDLKTEVDPAEGTVTLFPNFNTYADNPDDPFWVDQMTGLGNKVFEGNTFVEDSTLLGKKVTFEGEVESFTLDGDYEVKVYIKVFNADFSEVKEVSQPLTEAGTYSITFDNPEPEDAVVQYGFSVTGLNANPDDEAALGNVVLAGEGGGGPDEEVVGVDASADFLGFANVFETPANGGAFVFGSAWGVPDLKTEIDPAEGTVTLFPNFNTYADNPDDPFWVDQMTGLGNKVFEGNTFVEDSTLLGKKVTFEGEVESFTLDGDYEVKVYIKVFNADFSELKEVSQPLTEAGTYSITFDNPEPEDAVVQYGFSVTGLNANPDDEAALGNVVLVGEGGGGPGDDPAVAAPDPTEEEENVLSLFSGVYTNVDVDTWRTPWSSADLEDIEIQGNATKKYTNLDFVGVETTGDNLIDASEMETFHIDLWTNNMDTVRIKLVDWGADGQFDGGDDTEDELMFTDLDQGSWNSLELPLADFAGLENRMSMAQYIFSGTPSEEGTLYVDNVYFSKTGGSDPDPEPLMAAPDPTEDEADVLSMFSDVYTDVDVDTWRTPWSQGDLEDIEIEGNPTKKYTNIDFVGVETTGDNLIDATDMDFFHIDVWTPNMDTIRIKLVDFGADGEFDGGDDTEHELIFTDLPQGEWNSLQLPLEDFEGLAARNNLAQYIFSGLPTGEGTLYVDNVYFSKMTTSVVTPDAIGAKVYPNPTSEFVILETKNPVTSFTMYSMNGQRMLEKVNPGNKVNVSGLGAGLYIMEIKTNEGVMMQRLIIQ